MRYLAALILAVLPYAISAQEPAGKIKLADVAWLAGTWVSPNGANTICEESWSASAGGGMMGMFRLMKNGKPGIYEFMLIEEQADGLFLRLRHYRIGMAEMEEKPIKLRVTKATAAKIEFTNESGNAPKQITYQLDGADLLVTVETTRDGKPAKFDLRMVRAKVW